MREKDIVIFKIIYNEQQGRERVINLSRLLNSDGGASLNVRELLMGKGDETKYCLLVLAVHDERSRYHKRLEFPACIGEELAGGEAQQMIEEEVEVLEKPSMISEEQFCDKMVVFFKRIKINAVGEERADLEV